MVVLVVALLGLVASSAFCATATEETQVGASAPPAEVSSATTDPATAAGAELEFKLRNLREDMKASWDKAAKGQRLALQSIKGHAAKAEIAAKDAKAAAATTAVSASAAKIAAEEAAKSAEDARSIADLAGKSAEASAKSADVAEKAASASALSAKSVEEKASSATYRALWALWLAIASFVGAIVCGAIVFFKK